MHTISIVIPAKNEAEYIDKTLFSVSSAIEVSRFPCEVIVIDNGSADQTKEIAVSFGCKIIEDKHASIARLRNIGAMGAGGDIIAFLDADCVVDKTWINSCVEKVIDDNIGLVGTRAIPDLTNATWVEEGWYKLVTGVERPVYPNWIGSSNMFIRRNVFWEVGGFDENLETAEDVNFCNKIRSKYLIYLDTSISTIHLRESKTVFDLIRREIWRGKGSIRQFLISNSRLNELMSVVVPFAYNLMLVCMALLLVSNNNLWYVPAIFMLLMPLALIMRKKAKICSVDDMCKVYLVALYYLISRSIAMAYEVSIMFSNALRGHSKSAT